MTFNPKTRSVWGPTLVLPSAISVAVKGGVEVVVVVGAFVVVSTFFLQQTLPGDSPQVIELRMLTFSRRPID